MELKYVNKSQNEQPLFKKHLTDAGWDLRANETVEIPPGESRLVGTGIHMAIPEGYYGKIADRSGMAVEGVTTRAGVIDSDYRGEVKVLLKNEAPAYRIDISETEGISIFDDIEGNTVIIQPGERIAQLIIHKISIDPFVEVDEVEDLEITARGDGGFGSSGKV